MCLAVQCTTRKRVFGPAIFTAFLPAVMLYKHESCAAKEPTILTSACVPFHAVYNSCAPCLPPAVCMPTLDWRAPSDTAACYYQLKLQTRAAHALQGDGACQAAGCHEHPVPGSWLRRRGCRAALKGRITSHCSALGFAHLTPSTHSMPQTVYTQVLLPASPAADGHHRHPGLPAHQLRHRALFLGVARVPGHRRHSRPHPIHWCACHPCHRIRWPCVSTDHGNIC